MALARDFYLELAGVDVGLIDTFGRVDVAEGDGAAESVAVGGRAGVADESAVAVDRLVVIEQRLRILEGELDEALRQLALALLLQQRVAADEGHLLVVG